ncbi:MAG: hypothetical protein KF893_02420 [Caldilineaceae bacterium]|nr:hypothetical protein [Caldilineaceae bacterium]
MKRKIMWNRWLLGVVAVLMLVLGMAAVYPQVSEAADTSATVQHKGVGIPKGDNDELLAETLGITVEDLQSAREEASSAAIDQAVAGGLITEAQAEQLKERGAMGRFGGFMHPFFNLADSDIDPQALLAEALGISVEDLETAQAAAQSAALAQAVEEGRITQEQADQMQAHQALRPYLEERMKSAFTEAVQQALEDGVITQAQADQLSEAGAFGHFGRHGGMRGHDGEGFPGPRGRGGMPGQSGM